jgi:hypothetical protein
MPEAKRENRRYHGQAGHSIPGFAEEIGWSEKEVRRAVALGLIRTVEFGDRLRVPFTEAERLRAEGLVRPIRSDELPDSADPTAVQPRQATAPT